MNYQRLHLYFGVMARGEKKEGFKSTFYNDRIGPGTLIALRDTPDLYEIRPILKPARLLNDRKNQDVRDALDNANRMVPKDFNLFSNSIRWQAEVINYLRERGYDCDGLIDQGFAICNPNYDLNSLL